MKNVCKAGTLLLLILCIGCGSDDDGNVGDIDPVIVNLELAKLNDFQLSEIAYSEIEIVQPELVDGKEKTYGEIKITIPPSQNFHVYSLKKVNFDTKKFSISPKIGEEKLTVSGDPMVYTITSLEDPKMVLHYSIIIIQKDAPFEGDVEITGLTFQKSKNASLPSDIEALKIVPSPRGWSVHPVIYVMVPAGTDFANLTPTIAFEGSTIEYRTIDHIYISNSTANEFVTYPVEEKSLDFKYPKAIQLKVSDASGTKSEIYNVIVDVENPIVFDNSTINIPNVSKSTENQSIEGVVQFTNQGNSPIEPITNTGFSDIITPAGVPSIYTGVYIVGTGGGNTTILPSQKGQLNVVLSPISSIGLYQAKATFDITFNYGIGSIGILSRDRDLIEDLYNTHEIILETTVVDEW